MVQKTKKIGTVVSDTGKLIICDPDFLTDWKNDKFVSKKEYKDIQTGRIYTLGKDFKNLKEIILNNKSVNDLIAEKRFVRILYKETEEFSNKSITEGVINKSFSLCNFDDGRKGRAIAVGTTIGDGEFPVFAEYQDGQICKIIIDFTINLDE